MPTRPGEVERLIQESALSLPASLEVVDLARSSESCTARFRNAESGESEELSWP